jgi:hypothetical protein
MKRTAFAIVMLLASLLALYFLYWCSFDLWLASFGSRAAIRWCLRAAGLLFLSGLSAYGAYQCGRIALRRTNRA